MCYQPRAHPEPVYHQHRRAQGPARFHQQAPATITEAGVCALGIFDDPTRAERDVLLVLLRPRLDSPRVETTFWVTAAHVALLANFPRTEEMRGQLKLASDASRGDGWSPVCGLDENRTARLRTLRRLGFPEGLGDLEPLSTTWEEWPKKEAQCRSRSLRLALSSAYGLHFPRQ
ncbi:hypothetical protein B0H14DRAFT_3600866 [Mycena olivaceomarginata]|nr:hypothetical protein B0H14DRAFT_3600866 [Mycena olivaceomarginata]